MPVRNKGKLHRLSLPDQGAVAIWNKGKLHRLYLPDQGAVAVRINVSSTDCPYQTREPWPYETKVSPTDCPYTRPGSRGRRDKGKLLRLSLYQTRELWPYGTNTELKMTEWKTV